MSCISSGLTEIRFPSSILPFTGAACRALLEYSRWSFHPYPARSLSTDPPSAAARVRVPSSGWRRARPACSRGGTRSPRPAAAPSRGPGRAQTNRPASSPPTTTRRPVFLFSRPALTCSNAANANLRTSSFVLIGCYALPLAGRARGLAVLPASALRSPARSTRVRRCSSNLDSNLRLMLTHDRSPPRSLHLGQRPSRRGHSGQRRGAASVGWRRRPGGRCDRSDRDRQGHPGCQSDVLWHRRGRLC